MFRVGDLAVDSFSHTRSVGAGFSKLEGRAGSLRGENCPRESRAIGGCTFNFGPFFFVVCCVEGKTRAGFVVFKKECFIFAQR